MSPDAMRPRSRPRPETVRPRPNDLASRPHRPRGLNIPDRVWATFYLPTDTGIQTLDFCGVPSVSHKRGVQYKCCSYCFHLVYSVSCELIE